MRSKASLKTAALPELDEFTRFLEADVYFQRHEFAKAASELITYYQQHPARLPILASFNRELFVM